MKFQHLHIGQQFEYEGETYVKSGPLVATHSKTGQQKLIPRYAPIVVTDTGLTPTQTKSTINLESNQVMKAFETFYSRVMDSLQKLSPECKTQTLEAVQHNINAAREQFLSKLDLQE